MSKISPKITIRRDTFEWKVLNALEKLGDAIADVWLPKNYSHSKLWRDVFGLDRKTRLSEMEKREMKLIISKTLGRLKTKGLVAKKGSTRGADWRLTENGKRALSDEGTFYPLPEDGRVRVFIFDIPENRKEERGLLREVLTTSGYLMLQKSVWIGKRPLPESFMEELSERDLFEFVHIFEVKESGTLENLNWPQV